MPRNSTDVPGMSHDDLVWLDSAEECLRRGSKRLRLKAKAFAVLRALADQCGQTVRKEALMRAVWPDVAVSDWVLTTCVHEIRRALRDDSRRPRWIETVHGRGYRLRAALPTAPPGLTPQQGPRRSARGPASPAPPTTSRRPASLLVGRGRELADLRVRAARALDGARGLIFVTGEAGIGKTTLVETLLDDLGALAGARASGRTDGDRRAGVQRPPAGGATAPAEAPPGAAPHIAWGQCIEHGGASEAYFPILDALAQLAHGPDADPLRAVLSQAAPIWLAQLPHLLREGDLAALQPRLIGGTEQRMMRELAEALELLTATRGLVLVLEDLHWSDHATVELLSYLAGRRQPARLLIVGIYRTADVSREDHPLRRVTQELLAHRLATEVALEGLDTAEVDAYVARRFPERVFPARFVPVLHHRTEGNPLFLGGVVDDLVARGEIVCCDGTWMLHAAIETLEDLVPDTIRHLVARQQEQLAADERETLRAASVAGLEFAPAVVAAALGTEPAAVAERCRRLADRRRFLRRAGMHVWPDGRRSARYEFAHALYQQLWYEQVTVERAQDWHLRIGACKEAAYGARAAEIAAELAVHFEHGDHPGNAIRYYELAAQTALRRSANQDAIEHVQRALRLLPQVAEPQERARLELGLQLMISVPLIMSRGYAAAEVEAACGRARALCEQVNDEPQRLMALSALLGHYLGRGDLHTASAIIAGNRPSLQQPPDSAIQLGLSARVAYVFLYRADLQAALACAADALAHYDEARHRHLALLHGDDPGVNVQIANGWALQVAGYPERALASVEACAALAQRLAHPVAQLQALLGLMGLYGLRREWAAVRAWADRSHTEARAQGLAFWEWQSRIVSCWGSAMSRGGGGDIAVMRECLEHLRQAGVRLLLPVLLAMLAETEAMDGDVDGGLATLAEAKAVASETGQQWYDAELERLTGELELRLATRRARERAEASFRAARALAQRQGARLFELRATVSLARLCRRDGRRREAHAMVSAISADFSEGFDTADLRAAAALRDALDRSVQAPRPRGVGLDARRWDGLGRRRLPTKREE